MSPSTDEMEADFGWKGSIEEPAAHEALRRVLSDLPAIAKDGTAPGSMGGYKFRRVEDITAALKPLFAKHGVLCLPSVTQRIETERATAKGGIMYCVDLEICFRFVGPKGDELTTNVWGQGTDSGDKATQKAVTSAFKTMLSVVFCISDSELDAEAHDVPETHRPQAPAPAPKERIDLIREQVVAADLTEWVKDQGFPWPWTPAACAAIEQKVRDVHIERFAASPNVPAEAPPVPADASPARDGRMLPSYATVPTESVELPPCAEDAAEPVIVRGPATEPGPGQVAGNASAGVLTEVEIAAEVKAMKVERIRDALTSAGLSTEGTRSVLEQRLIAYRSSEAPF